MRLAPIALAALLAAALTACTGGEPPPAPPAATPTPAPTAEPTATPPASPTPDARSGLELIEPAPGAFVRRTFEDGEAIDWEHGVFVLDVETGRTEGYAVAGLESDERYYYDVRPGGWIATQDGSWRAEWGLLLHRETGDSWRWRIPALSLEATSEEHLLFEERRDRERIGRFIIANRLMEEVARFSVDARGEEPEALFSPDGHAVVLELADKVYRVPVATGRPAVLFDPPLRDDGHATPLLVRVDFRYAWISYAGGRGIVVSALYESPGADRAVERHHFSWEGEALPAPACPGMLSPDGRYAAAADGRHYTSTHSHIEHLEHPWPSVTVTDAETCAPIFRVRSSHAYERDWSARWLPTSEGIVVGVRGGYAIARVRHAPALLLLPSDYPDVEYRLVPVEGGRPGPDPAPTGDGRYFGYGSRVYDIAEGRWLGPPEWGEGSSFSFWWGASHRERWAHSPMIYWGDGRYSWLQLPPKIEYPPFAAETAFRVAGTGSCLRLREEPGEESHVLDCLPDGERLLFVESDAEPERDRYGYLSSPHLSLSEMWAEEGPWVRVRTEDGAEGWVSHGYLEHD